MPRFNTWFPTSPYGTETVNVGAFGPTADNVGRTLSSLGFTTLENAKNGVGGNGIAYPSATSLNDTADWCAITEALKLALKHEDPPGSGIWVSNTTGPWNNKAVFIPPNLYVTNKPIRIENIEGVTMFSTNHGANIFNENTTAPDNICFALDGVRYSHFQDMIFQARGTNAIAFDMNDKATPGFVVSTNSFLFQNCTFIVGGTDTIACAIGLGNRMCSEGTFIGCGATGIEGIGNATTGFLITNWNALNYHFLLCGGTYCDVWLRVNTGGAVVLQNSSFAGNEKDLYIGSGTLTAINIRTESKFFCTSNSDVVLISCGQQSEGNDNVFCEANGTATMINCGTNTGRLCGDNGRFKIEACRFSDSRYDVYTVSAGASNGAGGNLVRITHEDTPPQYADAFLDGDEVVISNIGSANTTAAGGAAHTNGVWTISKISATSCDLLGSVFVADTYTYTGALIGPGPRFHLRDILHPSGDIPTKIQTLSMGSREVVTTVRRDAPILFSDSGNTFDNLNAAGEVILTLPSIYTNNHRGVTFKFVVLTEQTLKIKTFDVGASAPYLDARIFRAGGYATAGSMIESNVVGSSLELYLADGDQDDPGNLDYSTGVGVAVTAHRWLVRAETGTWTISGTP